MNSRHADPYKGKKLKLRKKPIKIHPNHRVDQYANLVAGRHGAVHIPGGRIGPSSLACACIWSISDYAHVVPLCQPNTAYRSAAATKLCTLFLACTFRPFIYVRIYICAYIHNILLVMRWVRDSEEKTASRTERKVKEKKNIGNFAVMWIF